MKMFDETTTKDLSSYESFQLFRFRRDSHQYLLSNHILKLYTYIRQVSGTTNSADK